LSESRLPKTYGGLQFWTDWRWASGWRLQKFFKNETARIVDHKNRIVFRDTFQSCLEHFDELIQTGVISRPVGDVVILLHGLNRTRNSMRRIESEILAKTTLTPIRLSYASTRGRFIDHADGLAALLKHLVDGEEETAHDGVGKINFVCHSMGNIVTRRILYRLEQEISRSENDAPSAQKVMDRLGRMVMLGPPNQGSVMARWLKYSILFNLISSRGGREFSTHWNQVEPKLTVPKMQFGVIAGAQSIFPWVSNPFIPGTDDWTVGTFETKLDGEADRMEGRFLHGTIMKKQQVIDAALTFLETGRFHAK